MTHLEVEERLRLAFAAGLPGIDAQILLAPRPRPGWRAGHVPEAGRSGAGLVLIYPRCARAHVVLTVRAGHLSQHGGQVALPGGAVDAGETVAQAALREAREEIGVESARVRVLGTLTPLHIPVSGFTLHPVIGISDLTPAFKVAAGEVDRILEVPLSELLERSRLKRGLRWREGVQYDAPYFEVGGEHVWGATAMVLSEFLWLLGVRADPWVE